MSPPATPVTTEAANDEDGLPLAARMRVIAALAVGAWALVLIPVATVFA
jgi:hypothetical protein